MISTIQYTNNNIHKCNINITSNAPDWQSFFNKNPKTNIFHSPNWGLVMQQAYQNQPIYITARREKEISGILQIVSQKSRIFGAHLCSLPYFDTSGIVAKDEYSHDEIVKAAYQILVDERADWLELRHDEPNINHIPNRQDKVTMHLFLPSEAAELWDKFNPKVRNQIRKAQKAGLKVKTGGKELLKNFYQVYTRNMRDLGSPPHSVKFYNLITELFPDKIRLYIVYLNSQPIAASFTLTDKQAMRVPWAGSDWRYRKLNANMLLYWEMLAEGCRLGLSYFDFGRSTRDSGTYTFKKQWGALEVPLFWNYLLPEGRSPPELRPDNPKYHFAVSCWKKMPVWLSRYLGPRIIKNLC